MTSTEIAARMVLLDVTESQYRLGQAFETSTVLTCSGVSISSDAASMLAGDWVLPNFLYHSKHENSQHQHSERNLLLALQIQVQKMHSDDQRRRHGERESVAFQEPRSFGGGIGQDVRPRCGRLRHDVDED
jgi:hypothetical protein